MFYFLISSLFIASFGLDAPMEEPQIHSSGILDVISAPQQTNRYIISTNDGWNTIRILDENQKTKLESQGFIVHRDILLDFHTDGSRLGQITKAQIVKDEYGYTGQGINVAVVDTGVDFSNNDLHNTLARDEAGIPLMFDADGYGLVLTNTTFKANIQNDQIANFKLNQLNSSAVAYLTHNGVYLNTSGHNFSAYNPPSDFTSQNIINVRIDEDLKIGQNKRNFITSASGVYHVGFILQYTFDEFDFIRLTSTPVLVTDSTKPGIYDTITVDLSTSWQDFNGITPNTKPDFDFTDEIQRKLGDGNEFLVYDSNNDGKNDYFVGTLGSHVLDIYGLYTNETSKEWKPDILPPLDPNGEYFGIMTDSQGHGTSSSAIIASQGLEEYDIYNNSQTFLLPGVAPGAKLIPIRALTLGQADYAWMWATGFDKINNTWKYVDKRADIVSNSWGLTAFPLVNHAPGLDSLSLLANILSIPKSFDESYPGALFVFSAGNSGHGYGTIGLPNLASFGVTVGANTNNVHVGFGQFANQPRFGNTTIHMNHIAEFSSKGPGMIGDPKPDIISVGAFGFTPGPINQNGSTFGLFGGTSMSAPIVSGGAAILMEALKHNSIPYDPFIVKNILMAGATDINNDPFVQGSGILNLKNSIDVINSSGILVYNNDTYYNVLQTLRPALEQQFKDEWIPNYTLPNTMNMLSWFENNLTQDSTVNTTFTIQNNADTNETILITPKKLTLLHDTHYDSETIPYLYDPKLNESYTLNFIRLSDIRTFDNLLSYYDEPKPIPKETDLLILTLRFPFDEFMNQSAPYATDTQISTLYLYDWHDHNNDTIPSYDELSMVNRAGTWGTVQELRVSDPLRQFTGVPLVGVYPVPLSFSYWFGDRNESIVPMNYTLSAYYYTRDVWDAVSIPGIVNVGPNQDVQIQSKINTTGLEPGIHQGHIEFKAQHTTMVPVSFVVQKNVPKDELFTIQGESSNHRIYSSGNVITGFNMLGTYLNGDWRVYHLDIDDPRINSGFVKVSWNDVNNSMSVFVIDPAGKIIASDSQPGVFAEYFNWPTLDWLGMGFGGLSGGFYPLPNRETSTSLAVSINQTGRFGILVHSTIFDGESATESVMIAAKFSSIAFDNSSPIIKGDVLNYVGVNHTIPIQIIEDNPIEIEFFLDNSHIEYNISESFSTQINHSDGNVKFAISVTDIFNKTTMREFNFILDTIPPIITIPSLDTLHDKIIFKVDELNLDKVYVILNDEIIYDTFEIDTSNLKPGEYDLFISATDKAENTATVNTTYKK